LNSQYSWGAVVVDLTAASNSGTINGAIYQQIDPQSTGTGVINSFARIQPGGSATTSSGYNTTENNIFDTGNTDTFNHAITLGDVPIVNLSGTNYRQFLLDINENTGGGEEFISLDEIQIFAGGTANSNVTTFNGSGVLNHDGTLVYRMDAGMDNWGAMDDALNSGSGSGDMFLYVLDSLFSSFADSADVTLYSVFGLQGVDPTAVPAVPSGNYGVSDGYEEWAVLTPSGTRPGADAPEPMSLVVWSTLLGTYGACYAFRRNRRRAV